MKLYKDEHEAYVEKDQIDLFIADGWSKTKSELDPEVESETDDEELSEDSGESSEGSDDSGKTGKIRRPIKKK